MRAIDPSSVKKTLKEGRKNKTAVAISNDNDHTGEPWTCECGQNLAAGRARCGKCRRWKGGKKRQKMSADSATTAAASSVSKRKAKATGKTNATLKAIDVHRNLPPAQLKSNDATEGPCSEIGAIMGESTKKCAEDTASKMVNVKTNTNTDISSKATKPNKGDGGGSKDRFMNGIAYCQPIENDKNGVLVNPIIGYSEETLPPTLYKVAQRAYAKDDATGLLYPAFIRKIIWGPRSNEISMGSCSSLTDGDKDQAAGEEDDEEDDEEEDEDAQRWGPKRNCWHYYVHYMGWAVKWDRWVEEINIYDDSESSKSLAKLLTQEYKKVKPKRRGQKMSSLQVGKWMEKMAELEADHRRLEKQDKSGGEENGDGDNANGESKVAAIKKSEKDYTYTDGRDGESNETMQEHFKDDTNTDTTMEEETKTKSQTAKPVKKLSIETLQKQAQLHKSGLQMKRKKSISDRCNLPFNLKKILVHEWEVITQCDNVHNLPSKVSVREALTRYLESKLAPLRKDHENKTRINGKTTGKDDDDKMQIGEASVSNGKKKLGKEWIDMVEGIALFFDQALPVHLLFAEERRQYDSLRRQILAQRRNSAATAVSSTYDSSDTANATKPDGDLKQPSAPTNVNSTTNASELSDPPSNAKSPPPNFLPERMSEIYGCEHLLRLFIRLPGIVAEAPSISEAQSRGIFSKLGDLVRYLQKNQSTLFESSFRKLLDGEIRNGGKKVNGK
mmetsp:Transcript_24390/g.52586  ORF Transcript_24390/g.52586 Transcript_24390/m.52586 type:complete len:728 (+) Transcript_24390:1-2184(+)